MGSGWFWQHPAGVKSGFLPTPQVEETPRGTQMKLLYAETFLASGSYVMPLRGSLQALIGRSLSESESLHPKAGKFTRWLSAVALGIGVLMGSLMLAPVVHAEARLKDIVNFEGIRENYLMGYGLVVGLNGTGDKLKNNEFTSQSLIAFLERQGVNTRGTELKSRNVAAVTVTANLPAFSRAGGQINVSISAMGDAKSLQGGMLLATALYGADGEVYAVAQGPISLSGLDASGAAVPKGVPTNGYIANGGLVEKEVHFSLNDLSSLNIGLRNPDMQTAKHVAEAINKHLGVDAAEMLDPGTVHLRVPIDFKNRTAQLIAEIEQVPVKTDQVAKIVINEASGTVVMGENVRIDTVAVAQGNLVVRVEDNLQGGQPGTPVAATPAANAPVVGAPGGKLAILQHGASLRELVAGLNALGVGPRDLITILQTIKSAGALQAEVVAE